MKIQESRSEVASTALSAKVRRVLVAGVSIGVIATSCRQVIGIEEAELDPELSNPSGNAGGTAVNEAGAGSAAGGNGVAGASTPQDGTDALGMGASGGGAEAGTGGMGGEPQVPLTPCEEYCTAVIENCSGEFAVYSSYESCLSVCAFMPVGQPGDEGVDSVHCRLAAVRAAPNEAFFYCPAAGPGGDGYCGSNCEGLCGLAGSVCEGSRLSDDRAITELPSRLASCMNACANVPDVGEYTIDTAAGLYRGNHVQCRLYHISAAAVEDPDTHCFHALGDDPCDST